MIESILSNIWWFCQRKKNIICNVGSFNLCYTGMSISQLATSKNPDVSCYNLFVIINNHHVFLSTKEILFLSFDLENMQMTGYQYDITNIYEENDYKIIKFADQFTFTYQHLKINFQPGHKLKITFGSKDYYSYQDIYQDIYQDLNNSFDSNTDTNSDTDTDPDSV